MNDQSVQTLILGAIAIALLLQTALLIGFAIIIYRVRRPLDELIARTNNFLETAERGAKRADHALEQIEQIVDQRAEQADAVAKELLDRTQTQVRAANQIMSQYLRQIEELSEAAEAIFKKPLHEARALAAGFWAGVESVFSKRAQRKGRPFRAG